MKRKSNKKDKKNVTATVKSGTVPVLYQNIGGDVYAFAQIGAELYFGKVSVKSSVGRSVTLKPFEKEAA